MLIVSLEQLALSFPWASKLRAGDLQFIDDPFCDDVTSYLIWINCSPAERTGDDMLWIFVFFAVFLKTGFAESMPK